MIGNHRAVASLGHSGDSRPLTFDMSVLGAAIGTGAVNATEVWSMLGGGTLRGQQICLILVPFGGHLDVAPRLTGTKVGRDTVRRTLLKEIVSRSACCSRPTCVQSLELHDIPDAILAFCRIANKR